MTGLQSLARSGWRVAPLTTLLVALNGLAFVGAAAVTGSVTDLGSGALVRMGGNFAPLVTGGEWWRLLSALFLHAGVVHLAFNMFALYQVGVLVERLFGTLAFGAIYFGAGLLGSAASLWWRQDVVSVGASGAVFGVYGALLAFFALHRDAIPRATLTRVTTGAVLFVGYSLALGFGIAGIDNAAHLGGLAGGALLGGGFAAGRSRPAARLAAPIAALLALFLLIAATPDRSEEHRRSLALDAALAEFAAAERAINARLQSLQARVRAKSLSDAQAAEEIERDMIPHWDAHTQRLAQSHVADPEKDAVRTEVLRYASQRRDALALLVAAIRRNDPALAERARRKHEEALEILARLKSKAESTSGR